MDTHGVSQLIAGFFAFIAIIMSVCQIRAHGMFNRSRGRGHVIRIIGMVPVYCLEAWIGLGYPQAAMYLDALRDMYEAVVLYSFYKLCVDVMLDGQANLKQIFRNMEPVQHTFPFCCLKTWYGTAFHYHTKVGILQWVPVKVFTALLTFILTWSGNYDDSYYGWSNGYTYISIIQNVSQSWALYCLYMFYVGTKDHLRAFKPIPKFLCIKFVVFFTYWQSVLLSILIKLGIIEDTIHFSAQDFAAALQDFAICIEMFLAAFAHLYAFNVDEFKKYESSGVQQQNMWSSLIDVVDVRDVYQESQRQFVDSAAQRARQIYHTIPFAPASKQWRMHEKRKESMGGTELINLDESNGGGAAAAAHSESWLSPAEEPRSPTDHTPMIQDSDEEPIRFERIGDDNLPPQL